MKRRLAILLAALAALAAVAGPAPAAANGPWTTFIRAYTYYDLLAEGDTVWCSTGEAGLLLYQRRDNSFVTIHREPIGLASNHLTTLLRDRSGRLWVGTLGAGASRLSADGKKWDVVNRFDGLPSDSVTAFAARGDTLLIGTPRGITLWNGSEIAGSLPDGFNQSPFTNGSDWITGIAIHGDLVWVSTLRGVYHSSFSGRLSIWTRETSIPVDRPYQGIVADDTTLIALEARALYGDPAPAGNTPFRQSFKNPGVWGFANTIAGGGTISAPARIRKDRGKILLTTNQGIFQWQVGNTWKLVTDQLRSNRDDDKRSFAVTLDRDGIYFAADQAGLRESVGPDEWALRVPAGPPGNNILNVAVQGERVYVNTFDEGIGRFDGREWRIWPFGVGPCALPWDTTLCEPKFAFALLVDREEKKWFGCWDAVIDVLDDSLPTPDRIPPPRVVHHRYLAPLPNAGRYTCAWASAADSSGGRWFGMETNVRGTYPARGLHYFDSAGDLVAAFIPDSSSVRGEIVRALTVDRAGRLWVGYLDQGIDIFDLNSRPPSRPDILPPPTTVVGTERFAVPGLVAHGDTVWAFINKEIVAYKRTNAERIVSYPAPEGPGQNAVNPLAVARDGTVWVGTVSGIRVVDPRGNTQDFSTANSPLAADDVKAIRVDWATGVVWIGTARGLNRYDPGYRPAPPPAVPQLEFKIYPNPGWLSSIGISLKLDGNATSYRGEVYDLRGRRLSRFSGVGNQGVVWDGRTDQGDLVSPGIYFFRVESGGKSGTSRVILLR